MSSYWSDKREADLNSRQSKVVSMGTTAEVGTFGTKGNMAKAGTFGTKGRLAGEPKKQRDSEDGIETIIVNPPEGTPLDALQLVQVAVDDLCVTQGTIQNIIPKIGATALAPNVQDNSLSLPGTGTRGYWLKITLLDGSITGITIETADPGDDTATQAKLLLGSVETNSGDIVSFQSNLSGSQSMVSCGPVHYFGLI